MTGETGGSDYLKIQTASDGFVPLRVAELFAGVGGFRLGMESAGHDVVWSSQWEPGTKSQHASDCYVRHFGKEGHSNQDIHDVRSSQIPDHDLLVGGFPCQDYSVAATLDKSRGIEGKKGILWWQINRILRAKRPPYLLLENVDRLLKSPAHQRGRDFAIVLSCLAKLGYRVEWRVINAADYGFPHRRRRVFIFGAHKTTELGKQMAKGAAQSDFLAKNGFFAQQFPVVPPTAELVETLEPDTHVWADLKKLSKSYEFEFQNSGVMSDRDVWTHRAKPKSDSFCALSSVLEKDVAESYYVPEALLPRWKYLKGAKNEERVAKNGHRYRYSEGAIPYPDRIDVPSRTILTGEGGTGPSRSNHIIKDIETGRIRTLTPVECERLNGFADNWTKGMPDRWRYFCMGNALVVGAVGRMALTLNKLLTQVEPARAKPSTISVKAATLRKQSMKR